MDDLRALFGAFCTDAGEVEARSMLFFSLLIGNRTIAADHGARSRPAGVAQAQRQRETKPRTPPGPPVVFPGGLLLVRTVRRGRGRSRRSVRVPPGCSSTRLVGSSS
jgi:hypothetical protein